MKNLVKIVLLLVMIGGTIMSATSCYFFDTIQEYQVGLHMDDGVSITKVLGPGRYTDNGFRASLKTVDISAKNVEYTSNDAWSQDKQPLQIRIVITYNRESETIQEMYSKFNLETFDDDALERLVTSRIDDAVKNTSTSMTLDQMLGIDESSTKNRHYMASQIKDKLSETLATCSVNIVDIQIKDIIVADSYLQLMQEKSDSLMRAEVAKQKTLELQEQMNQEKEQTNIALEQARRDNLVKEEQSKVYATSPELFELAKIEAMRNLLKDSDKVYFVPENADLSLFLSGLNQDK